MADDDTASVWKALSDPTRRRILDLLSGGPMTTGRIAGEFPISRIAVMKHLDTLRAAGLVTDRKRGRERWHYVNATPLRRVYERWFDPTARRWAAAFTRLEHHAEAIDMTSEPTPGTQAARPLDLDIAMDVPLAAPRARVFAALVDEPGAWWGRPYLDRAATDLRLEPVLGGRFYELWDGREDAGALLAVVSAIVPGRRLDLTGPLHMGVVYGVARFELADDGDGTLLRFSHRAVGHVAAEIAAQVAGGWTELLAERLRAYVERGERRGVSET